MLEDVFTRWWHEVRQRLGDERQPVLIRSGDDLQWLYAGEKKSVAVVGAQYHAVKRIAHVPVVLATLAMSPKAPEADEWSAAMQPLQSVSDEICLGNERVAPASISSLHSACEEFAEHLRRNGRAGSRALRRLADRSFPAVNRLIAAAAGYEVDQLHAAVSRIERETPPEALDNTYFVVCAGLQPRYRELSKSYFRAFVDNRVHTRGGAGHRVIFVEGKDDLDTVLDHVARRECNRVLAEVMTGSPEGLDQDILGIAAQRAIRRVFDQS